MNNINNNKRELAPKQREQLLRVLKARFEKNMNRHRGLECAKVQARLEAHTEKLWSLNEMERTGGEPDVVGHDKKTGEYIFYDCSSESPKGRRSVCYDREALEARKEHKPADNAIDMAAAMGIELLTEEQYRELQKLGEFDTKTSSWVKTPSDIRKLSGALFCDRRYDTVFVYHNGAESYYAARGFRGSLRVYILHRQLNLNLRTDHLKKRKKFSQIEVRTSPSVSVNSSPKTARSAVGRGKPR